MGIVDVTGMNLQHIIRWPRSLVHPIIVFVLRSRCSPLSCLYPFFSAVDGALVNALLKLGIVDAQKAAMSIKGLMWTRASRTDRGVHALGNVITVKVGMR